MKRESSQEQRASQLDHKTFSPTNNSQMSNFFSTKGPIKAQNFYNNQAQSPAPNSSTNSNEHLKQTYHAQIPGTSNIINQDEEDEDEYYGEEDEDDDMGQKRDAVRIFTPEQEAMILRDLHMSAQKNTEFLKVLNILQNDPELRPLIFEHEALLSTLKVIGDLKAEQMLSILTAAETEMYENTRTKENQQLQQKQQSQVQTESKTVQVDLLDNSEKDELIELLQKSANELESMKVQLTNLEQVNNQISQELKAEKLQRDALERENECTFRNLSEENKQLKKQFENNKNNEFESQRAQEAKIREINSIVDKWKTKCSQLKDELKIYNQQEQSLSKKELNNQKIVEKQQQDIRLLERDNENLQRKMNMLYNQVYYRHLENTQQLLEDSGKLQYKNSDKNSSQNEWMIIDQNKNLSKELSLQLNQKPQIDGKFNTSYAQNSLYYDSDKNSNGNYQSKLPRSYSYENIGLQKNQSKLLNQYEIGENKIKDSSSSKDIENKGKLFQLNQKGLFNQQVNLNNGYKDKYEALLQKHNDLRENFQQLQEQVAIYKQEVKQTSALNNEMALKLQQQTSMGKYAEQSLLMSPQRDQTLQLSHQNITPPYKQNQNQLIDTFQLFNIQSPIQPSISNDIGQDKVFEQYEKLQYDFRQKIAEIGSRLINLFKRMSPSIQELMQFNNQEFSVTILKDIIYEIGLKIDQIYEFQSRSRHMSQGQFYQQNHGNPFSGNSSPLDASTFEMKNLLLEEKERRLLTVEELNKSREQHIKYQQDIEKLKQELFSEKQQNQNLSVSQLDYHSHSNEQLNKHNQHLQQRVDFLQDENVTLKLKISELENEICDERQQKVMKYDYTIDNYKSSIQGQYLDYKIRFDELLMAEKENCYKYRVEIQGLIERNQILNEQLVQYRDRIQELEKESVQYSKENYVLQNELDYENIKSNQLQNKQVRIREEIIGTAKQDISKFDNIVSKSEQRLKEQHIKFQEQLLQKQSDIENLKLSYQALENEHYRIKEENKRLKSELVSNQSLLQRQQVQQNQEQNSAVQSYLNKSQLTKLGAIIIKQIVCYKQQFKIASTFYKMKILVASKKQEQILRLDSKNSGMIDNDQKYQQLEEQIYKFQQQNTQIIMQIGKLLRSLSQKQPIKLNLSGLVSKLGLDYLLSGLKNNTQVYELNLSNCGLDDEDLQKIGEKLKQEKGITSLKLGQNIFNNVIPLIDLLQSKAKQYNKIDISDSYFDQQALTSICNVISIMEKIEDISLASTISKNNNTNQKVIKILFDLLASKKSIKSIDLSKNKFQQESIDHILSSLQKGAGIEKLSLNRIGLSDQHTEKLIFTINSLSNLKRLDISGNNLSSDKLSLIIQSLKNNANLEDLDISKSNLKNELTCCKELGVLILNNNKLRQLVMIKSQLNDSSAYHLIQPIAQSFNIEVIKLDFNQLGPVFIERFIKYLLSNKFTQSVGNNRNQNSQSSFYDDSDSSVVLDPKQSRKQGLINISLEGNNIGDRGAKAIADLIRTPNDSTKNLKMVNLNECGITNQGFEELRNALMQRASLASVSGLSHVKITIERNNIE